MNGWLGQRVLATTTLVAAAPARLPAAAPGLTYAQADARMNRGVTLAVITLAAVVYMVIIGVLMLTAYLLHRKQRRRKNQPQHSINL